MEKEFYNDNFEQLLKDATEDFKMYPSRKVWNSLYNDLHPAKRWPSLAVCLLLITSILYVGVTNNNSINNRLAAKSLSELTARENGTAAIAENNNSANEVPSTSAYNNYQKQIAEQERVKELLSFNLTVIPDAYSETPAFQDHTAQLQSNLSLPRTHTGNNGETGVNAEKTISQAIPTLNPIKAETINTGEIIFPEKETVISEKDAENVVNDLASQSTLNDKAWIDNHAFYNRINKGKWKARSILSYYITPSIGYRNIQHDGQELPATNTAISSTPVMNADEKVDHYPSINLEAGASIAYSISKKIRVKGGIQFNYNNYKVNAYELKHPAQTTLMLREQNNGNLSLQPYNTTFANSPALSSSRLNNKIVQLSVPVGIDYRIAGTERIQWFAGATLQPSYITTGNVFLLSSDRKFYVNDNSFIRRFNLNSSFETFVSYKTNSGIILNAGPQVRYQLLSTYSKQITYSENAYNIGLKLGISRSF